MGEMNSIYLVSLANKTIVCCIPFNLGVLLGSDVDVNAGIQKINTIHLSYSA